MVAKIVVNKIEGARRQIDAAIRMLFNHEDPVAIHTLSMAGFRILKDLSENADRNSQHKQFTSMIRPGKEKEFWGKFHSFANFLKHAERDPESIIDNVDEEINDSTLVLASTYYQDLGNQFTPEMIVMCSWYIAIHPDIIDLEQAPEQLKTLLDSRHQIMRGLARTEQLKIGKEMLGLAKQLERRY